MKKAELIGKLQRLEVAADHAERNSLAVELANTSDHYVFETIVELIQRSRLEPIMKVEVVTPEEYLGDVIGDMNSRRGQIQGTDTRGNVQAVEALVPLAKLFGYADELRSLSQGCAVCTMQFAHYDEGPNDGGSPDTEPVATALRA